MQKPSRCHLTYQVEKSTKYTLAHSRMQRLLPRLRLYHRLSVFCAVEVASFLVNPCFACIVCWTGMPLLVQVDPLRCVGTILPTVRLDGLDLLI